MNSSTSVILFLALIAFSLAAVSFVNRVQTRNRLVRQKSYQLQRRIDDLEEICAGVEPLLESVLIPKLLNDEILDLIRSVQKLDPLASVLDIKQERANELEANYDSGQRAQPFYRIQSSDSSIAKHKHYLTEAARVVRRHQMIGRLEIAEMESYVKELAWAHLMVDVISLVAQGHRAVNREDPVVAYGYYRKAQNLMMNTHLTDERRHRFIREIGEILAGHRLALDRDLMPESEFNPTRKPHFQNDAADGTNTATST